MDVENGSGQTIESVVVAAAPDGAVLFSTGVPELVPGRRLPELAQSGEFRIFHSDGRVYAPAEWPLARSLSGEVILGEEFFRPAQDGARLRFRINSYPVQGRDGEIVAAVSVARDISAEVQVERHLAYHASLLGNVEDAVVGTDPEFRITVWNRGAERLYGYTAAEVLGREAREVGSHAGDRSRLGLERELLETDRIRTEITAYRKDGTTVEVELISVAVRDDGGAITGYLGIHRDVTERRRADDERDRRARQQGLIAELGLRALAADDLQAALDEAVATTARGMGLAHVGIAELLPGGEELLLRAGVGWSEGAVGTGRGPAGRESLVGYTVMAGEPVVSEELASDPRFELSPFLRSHNPVSAVSVLIPGRTEPFGALGAFSPVRRSFSVDDVNFLQAVANVTSSAVEREQSERAIVGVRQAERRRIARDLHDEALQNLTDALAHATALAGVARRDETDDRLAWLAAALKRAGQEVRGAIYDLRLGAEENQSFRDLLEGLVDVQQELTAEHRIELHVSDEVPDALGRAGTELLRVAAEAVVNARRYSGARVILVDISCADGHLCVKVSDDGRGFAAGAEGWLDGTGIQGMRERAELLRGELHIESELGAGTTVVFEVPMDEEPGASERPSRVLLVEDHAAVREAIAAMFESEPDLDVVRQAGSVREARSGLADIDVAVVDLGLPDGYGGDLIRELREVNPRAQALVLSASLDRVELARAVESGAAGALNKSVNLGELVGAVRRVRAGETLLPLDEIVDLLRFAGREREREHEDRQALETLTRRELEVLQLLAEGLGSQAIADRLHITLRTERNHVASILTKLGVHSRLQAVVFALRYGVVEVR